jgi:iron complex transport system ATP-binding protein
MEALRLECVTINTGGISLLESVSVSVNNGEVLGIIGPNGAGKTTLLKSIGCDVELTSGLISIAGQPIKQIDARQRACQVAILPQLSSLNFPYTVEEVVELSRIPHSTGRRCDREIVREVLHAMDILYLRERLYTHLSGGEKQRVHLARAMAQIWRIMDASTARLLLLDEPTSALDLGHQQQLMQVVRCLANQGVAVIMVVHDINLVARYADSILALSGGRVVAYGQPKDIIKAEVIKQLYAVDVRVINHPDHNRPVVLGL